MQCISQYKNIKENVTANLFICKALQDFSKCTTKDTYIAKVSLKALQGHSNTYNVGYYGTWYGKQII